MSHRSLFDVPIVVSLSGQMIPMSVGVLLFGSIIVPLVLDSSPCDLVLGISTDVPSSGADTFVADTFVSRDATSFMSQ